MNGLRVQKTRLNTGDQVQFGKNGVTADVRIDNSAPAFAQPEDFRQAQIQNYQQAVQNQPVNLQNSMSNIGLGKVEVRPEPNRTGRYVGIGVTIFAIIFMSLIVDF